MNNARIFLLVFLLFPCKLKSQVFPKEGALLHYRLIGFSFPSAQTSGKRHIEIAAGNYHTEDSFKRNVINTIYSAENKIIAEVPSFGMQYTWRIVNADPTKTNSELYHFSTGMIPAVDTSLTRLRVIHNAAEYKDAYVFLDGHRALYDMKGHPVWYLPYINGFRDEKEIRDLKLSPQGNITLLYGDQAYEINYSAEVLWKGPDNGTVNQDSIEYYHNELTRLQNGHYMVLGREYKEVLSEMPGPKQMKLPGKPLSGANPIKIRLPFGTLIEYDEKGKVVWSWKSSNFFTSSDMYYTKMKNDLAGIDVHDNSFFFNLQTKAIYVGFKHISSIIKLQYPEGKILNTYGSINRPVIPERGIGFSGQHSCKILSDGSLVLFNNNDSTGISIPSVILYREPLSGFGELTKIWEYQCSTEGMTIEKLPKNAPRKLFATSGGNVEELPDRSLFVSMNNIYSKVFIVSRAKHLLWSAVAEKRNSNEEPWTISPQYRASIIAKPEDITHLILH